jgi:regulator of protease activity HflC (stomatin/prohibitin superfamily)
MFATTQTIVVNQGEVAVVLEDGRSNGALEPGRYVFSKARVVGSLDIVWIRTGQQALKWGIGNVTSADGIQIGGNGVVYVRVRDGIAFNAEIVQGAIALGEVDLQRFLMPRIQGVLRTGLSSWPAMDLQTQREAFVAGIRTGLGETFARMGLEIVDFEVVEINFPPEFKAVIAQATMASFAGQAALVTANTRAQVSQLESQAAAAGRLTTGMVEVQLLAQLQAQGIDPLKLKALEALNTFAANPGQAGPFGGGDAARALLFGQIATAATTGPPAPVAQPPRLEVRDAPPTQAAPEPSGPTRAELERQIDALVERLAEGKISEETYNKLVARLEAKLAAMG